MATVNFRGNTYTIKTAKAKSQTLIGTPLPDWFSTTFGGNNTFITGKGNDVVLAGVNFGSTGNYPPFRGEAIFWSPRTDGGNNIISTGDGNDYVAAIGASNVVDLGAGDDIFDSALNDISKTTGDNIIDAGAGNDIIYDWGVGSKIIDGGTGNDSISVLGFGNTILTGGEGNDIISVRDGAGFSEFKGGADRHIIDAGAGNDFISASSSDDIFTIEAGAGNDFLNIESEKSTFNAGTGDDDLYVTGNGNKISGGSGNDLIYLDAVFSTGNVVFADSGDDTIFTNPSFIDPEVPIGKHEIHGGEGNDTIVSGIGDDTIYADGGKDLINLRGGFVNLRGRLASDYFGTDKLEVKGGGTDTIFLSKDKDRDTVMLGKEGKAIIYGFTSLDRLDLGMGSDKINVSVTRNLQGDTLITTNDLFQIQLATLVDYTGSVGII
jgi:Ca2+-binding RTX toxin-like protein